MPERPPPLKLVEGGKSKATKPKPTKAPKAQAPPPWLGDKAMAVWADLAPVTTRLNLLTEATTEAFAVLCDALADYREASTIVSATSVLVRDGTRFVENPAVGTKAKTGQRAITLLREFGLTPAAMLGLGLAPTGEPADDVLALLS